MKMMLLRIFVFCLAAALALGFFSSKTQAATIQVDLNQALQRLDGLGGNYVENRYTYTPNSFMSASGDLILNQLKPIHVRGVFDIFWEPINDNNDPSTFNWTGFKDATNTHSTFLQLQYLKQHGVSTIVLSLMNAPDWMVSNPTTDTSRVIPPSMYDEAIESIVAFLLRARDNYGITVEYFNINEASKGYANLKFTSTEMRNFIQKAGKRFQDLGLTTKWLLASSHVTDFSWVQVSLDDPVASQYIKALGYHSYYSSLSGLESSFAAAASLAKQYDRPLWVEEIGWDPLLWQRPQDLPTWKNAWNYAKSYHRVIKFGLPNFVLYWAYDGSGYSLADESKTPPEPYPAFYVIKQLVDNFPSGIDIMEVTSDDSVLWPLAGKHKSRNQFSLQVINTAISANQITISGLPNTILTLFRTSATENMKTIGSYPVNGGTLILTLPAESINTLSGPLAGTPASADTTPPTISSIVSSSITSSGATITWSTNEISDSQVEYGTSTSYGSSTTLNTSLVTSHSIALSGLNASTLYHYRVKSRDGTGNITTSGDNTFTTAVITSPPTTFSQLYEAESMLTKTTGGSITGGWNIWANGYIEDSVNFPTSGDYNFKIIAYGSFAGEAWPNMELRIDQVAIKSFTVNANVWTTFITTQPIIAGTHKVAIAFTNDYYDKTTGADRNLIVDKIEISSASISDTTPPAPPTGLVVR